MQHSDSVIHIHTYPLFFKFFESSDDLSLSPHVPSLGCLKHHSRQREQTSRALSSLFACHAPEHQEIVDVQLDLVTTSS